jgi:CheY-like chemotaxis protein/anti-sigma regulatory factor (Ser/Thr protein kinase)
MRVLIVDDVYSNRATLEAMLVNIGHQVFCAKDGIEGISVFEREQPDLVIMDVLMPNMDGYDATRVIKQRCGDRFVPVIFVTTLIGTDDLVQCIEVGGDDFLARPFEIELLKAKLVAFGRMIAFYGSLRHHELALQQQNRRLAAEMRIGQNVLTKLINQGINQDPCFRHWTLPAGVFSGDLFFAARTPAGGVNVLFGDVTGHGLSAAIGAQPVADIFYGMTSKGYSIGDISGEINRRMRATLYPEIFCAACLLELDPERTTLTVWNGAMPDVIVTDLNGGEPRRVRSSHHALGVVEDAKFDRRPEVLGVGPADRILLCSDGFIESKNACNERYGLARFAATVREVRGESTAMDSLRRSFFEFLDSASPADDVSVLEIVCGTPAECARTVSGAEIAANAKPARWQAEVTLYADSLGLANPAPVITNLIMQIQSPHSHRERIFTIVSELVTNAVDHGLLGLDSELKGGPQGFTRYFQRRTEALAELRDGWVRVRIDHVPDGDKGTLRILVEDSGPGFDVPAALARMEREAASGKYSGRGVGLVRKLCSGMQFNAKGNAVEVVYPWAR